MELLEFKNQILKLCNTSDLREIGNILFRVVLSNVTQFYDEYNTLVANESKDWLQAFYTLLSEEQRSVVQLLRKIYKKKG